MLGQTPIFKAIMTQNSEMFNLLLDSKSDITKKELMNNESVRDSVFRYCPEDASDFLSIGFLTGGLGLRTQSIMDAYRRHEAQLMIDTLTKECKTRKEKLVKLVSNFRSDPIFIQYATKFFVKEFVGENGPIRLKQALFLIGYIALLLMIWTMNGLTKLSIILTLVFLLSVLSFAWVGFWSYDTKSLKLNVMMDLKMPNHLITAILEQIEKRQFE